jgi:uncharacterized membrane protein YkvA (DUF1232 family)
MTDDDSTQSEPPQPPKQLLLFWEVLERLPRYLRMSLALVSDERVPNSAKVALIAGGAYAISPIDAIPGFIPVAGQLDDLLVVLFSIRGALALCPTDVTTEYLAKFKVADPGIDADIKTTLTTVRWLAGKTLSAARRLAAWQGRMLFQTSARVAGKVEQRFRPASQTRPPDPA